MGESPRSHTPDTETKRAKPDAGGRAGVAWSRLGHADIAHHHRRYRRKKSAKPACSSRQPSPSPPPSSPPSRWWPALPSSPLPPSSLPPSSPPPSLALEVAQAWGCGGSSPSPLQWLHPSDLPSIYPSFC